MEPFSKYAGADEEDTGIHMECDVLDATTSNLSIGEILLNFEKATEDFEAHKAEFPWADRFVMGFPLPKWQRQLVWTNEQKVKFIRSAWGGIDLGSYMVNRNYEFINEQAGPILYREFSDVLLDGQQRLNALQEYVTNEFAVPDENGIPRYWKELGKRERRRFGQITFARAEIKTWDETLLRKAYDARSFGGTPHKESERASDEK